MDTCICMAESLHCSPETITALLIIYTPIGNKKLKKKDFAKKMVHIKKIINKTIIMTITKILLSSGSRP